VVALGKGVRAGAHPMVGLTRGVEKRSAWWRSSVRRLVRWLLTSGATPAARRKGRGEALVYSKENSTRGKLTIRGAVGGAFVCFPVNNGGLRRRAEDKRQEQSARAAVECSCGRDFLRRWTGVVVDLPAA
jgi:hypothetical protein